jgi:hypothetical protein
MDTSGHHSIKLDGSNEVDAGDAGDENSILLSNITESEAEASGDALNPDGLSEVANSIDSAALSAANRTAPVVESQVPIRSNSSQHRFDPDMAFVGRGRAEDLQERFD